MTAPQKSTTGQPPVLALTHAPSPKMEECQLTFLTRTAIDFQRALQQHDAYCQMLRDCGALVRVLDVNREFPDSVFIEDTAVVLDEVALLGSMGTSSRRAEPAGIEAELAKHREIHRMKLPATLEGGDVLRVGRNLLVGVSSRTNKDGIEELASVVRRFGYSVIPVPVRHCLHLKTACTALPDGSLLVNPDWIEAKILRRFDIISISPNEPWAANVALIENKVCMTAAHAHTMDALLQRGFSVRATDLSEFAKAEGGVTCLSLLFSTHA